MPLATASTFQLIVKDDIQIFTKEEQDNGWNKENYEHMKTLMKEVKALENAHRECRDINSKANNAINILLMCFAGTTTMLVALNNAAAELGDPYYYFECGVTGVTTILSALNTFYHNDANSKDHHTLSRNFYRIGNKIKLIMVNGRKTIKFEDAYNKYLTKVSAIRENSISMFPKIRKKYGISDKLN